MDKLLAKKCYINEYNYANFRNILRAYVKDKDI